MEVSFFCFLFIANLVIPPPGSLHVLCTAIVGEVVVYEYDNRNDSDKYETIVELVVAAVGGDGSGVSFARVRETVAEEYDLEHHPEHRHQFQNEGVSRLVELTVLEVDRLEEEFGAQCQQVVHGHHYDVRVQEQRVQLREK